MNKETRFDLNEEQLEQVSGGIKPEPTKQHWMCADRYSPDQSPCKLTDKMRKTYADQGECDSCPRNPIVKNTSVRTNPNQHTMI